MEVAGAAGGGLWLFFFFRGYGKVDLFHDNAEIS